MSDELSPSEGPSRPTAYAWVVVGLLFVVAFLNYMDRLMLTSMHDPIRAAVPMNDAQFGLLTSVFLWVYAGASPLGIALASPSLDLAKTVAWKDGIVGRLTNGVAGLLRKAHVKSVKGWASFRDGKTVAVDDDARGLLFTGVLKLDDERAVFARLELFLPIKAQISPDRVRLVRAAPR